MTKAYQVVGSDCNCYRSESEYHLPHIALLVLRLSSATIGDLQ